MIGRISQLKQTLSDEFQQASQQRPANDPIAVIERNSKLLTSETPNVDSIIMDLEDSDQKPESISSDAEKNDSPTADEKTSENSPGNLEKEEEHTKGQDSQGEGRKDQQNNAESQNRTTGNPTERSEGESTENNSEETIQQNNKEHSVEPVQSLSKQASREASPVDNKGNDTTLQAKLAKFAKYEEKYPQLLKAYKLEKKRGELVKLYEKVLSEHTPCSSIAEPQILIDYLNEMSSKNGIQQKELQKIHSELTNSQKQVTELRKELSNTKNELASTKSNLSKVNSDLEALQQKSQQQEQAASNSAIDARREVELKAKIDTLQSQLDAAEQSRESAAKSQATIRTQFEELNTRLRENFAEIDVLRDELQEAERLAQDRLHELSSLRGQLHNHEKGRRRSADETVTQLSKVIEEKEQLEADVELLNKRIIRESDQLNLQIKSLRTQLHESETHEAELRRQLSQSQSLLSEPRSPNRSTASSVVDLKSMTIDRAANSNALGPSGSSVASDAVAAELAEARESASTAKKANELLKQVNSDNALRIEKLQKSQRALSIDLEQLRHENMLLKKQSRRGSVTTVSSGSKVPIVDDNEDAEKQQAYLKNVLLGFMEHKGQRKALMPVLATLLGMKDSEMERFMKELV